MTAGQGHQRQFHSSPPLAALGQVHRKDAEASLVKVERVSAQRANVALRDRWLPLHLEARDPGPLGDHAREGVAMYVCVRGEIAV